MDDCGKSMHKYLGGAARWMEMSSSVLIVLDKFSMFVPDGCVCVCGYIRLYVLCFALFSLHNNNKRPSLCRSSTVCPSSHIQTSSADGQQPVRLRGLFVPLIIIQRLDGSNLLSIYKRHSWDLMVNLRTLLFVTIWQMHFCRHPGCTGNSCKAHCCCVKGADASRISESAPRQHVSFGYC